MKKNSWKKNYVLRVAGLLLLACVLALNASSGVVSRYAMPADFAPQYMRVAAFRVLVGGEVLGKSELDVNLFETLYSSVDNIGTTDTFTVQQTADSTQAASSASRAPVIAPGNGGEFSISVQNQSEVPVRYSINVKKIQNDHNIPIEVRMKDGANWTDWNPVGGSTAISGGKDLTAGGGATSDALFQWRWVYALQDDEEGSTDPAPDSILNARNRIDTALGIQERVRFDANAGKQPGDEGYVDNSQKLILTIEAKAEQLD